MWSSTFAENAGVTSMFHKLGVILEKIQTAALPKLIVLKPLPFSVGYVVCGGGEA